MWGDIATDPERPTPRAGRRPSRGGSFGGAGTGRSLLAAALAAAFVGCGGERTHTAPPAPAASLAPVHTPPPELETRAEGLALAFEPTVTAEQAREYVLRCRAYDPEGHPAAARLTCPVDLGALRIDVREGPMGPSLMIYTGDPQVSEDLRRWFEEQQHYNE